MDDVTYTGLIPYLVSCIKEQQLCIGDLKAQIEKISGFKLALI
jgi:hypothetical protein